MSRPTPRTLRRAAIAGGLLAGLAVPSAAFAADPSSQAVVLTTNNAISTFETAHPEEASTPVAVTGLTDGDKLVGIDFRPQNGYLYGLGRNATAGTVQLYAISSRTGVAGRIGGRVELGGTDAATQFGFDFNPVVDRIRVVSTAGLNARLDPNTGALAGTDTVIPAATKVDGSAYTNNTQNAKFTTLYSLSGADNKLYIQNGAAPDPVGPNGGTQTAGKAITLGGAAVEFGDVGGFDIAPGVDVGANNAAVTTGFGYAAFKVGTLNFLAKIDLATGNVTSGAPIGAGTTDVQGLAVQQEAKSGSLPAVSLQGSTLNRFDITAPAVTAPDGTTTPINTTNLTAGETPAAIDYRPQTGQLLLFAVNADADTGSLYVVDPQNGALTRIGAASSAKFVGADGTTATDLPPVASGYDIDVNPTVDRVRVVTGSGLNFRLNPTVAADASVAVDGDNGLTTATLPAGQTLPTGTQPDGKQGPADSTTFGLDVTGTAYTNSFGQVLPAPGAAAIGKTTQYGISASKKQLQIQGAPNQGTQTASFPLKVGADALNVAGVQGFDIPSSVSVADNAKAATGPGVAALSVGATGATTSGLYAIDLSSGGAAKLGDLNTATTSFALGDGPAPLKARTTPPATGGGGGTGGGTPTTPTTPTIPTVPTTPTTPAKAAFGSSTRITLKLRASRVSRKGPAKITYRNTNKFAVKARFSGTTPKSGKRKAIKYRTKSFTLKASRSRTLNVALPSAAQRVLRTKKKLTIKVTLRVTAPNGKSRNVRKTLTVRLKK